jgi:hypothetical protein
MEPDAAAIFPEQKTAQQETAGEAVGKETLAAPRRERSTSAKLEEQFPPAFEAFRVAFFLCLIGRKTASIGRCEPGLSCFGSQVNRCQSHIEERIIHGAVCRGESRFWIGKPRKWVCHNLAKVNLVILFHLAALFCRPDSADMPSKEGKDLPHQSLALS